jgi:hypothetical protein
MGQKYAAYDSTGAITAFYDSIDSPAPRGTEVIGISDAQWQTCIGNPGWTVDSGELVAPIQASAAQISAQRAATAWAVHQVNAKAALDASDTTILRCYENGVVVPHAWAAYRQALREVVGAASGDPSQGLPPKPPYPSGT